VGITFCSRGRSDPNSLCVLKSDRPPISSGMPGHDSQGPNRTTAEACMHMHRALGVLMRLLAAILKSPLVQWSSPLREPVAKQRSVLDEARAWPWVPDVRWREFRDATG